MSHDSDVNKALLIELGMAQAALAMDEPEYALLHVRKAEKAIDCEVDDDPCATCPVQGCEGSHCKREHDARCVICGVVNGHDAETCPFANK